ncbi:MAG TPA: rod-binding protein [Tepidisphaeraceae bacterium]|nr:rod-binding protein [Tepidisphaeraceae bacterium]
MHTAHAAPSHALTQPSASSLAAAKKKHEALVQQTQKWVANAFYGTLLKKMRESPFKSEIFDGGRGGQMFTALFDQQLADRMSKSAPDPLVKSIVAKIEGGKASAEYLKQSRLPADLADQARNYVTTAR